MSLTSRSESSFTATIATPIAIATNINKVTIESSDHRIWPCALLGPCFIGDTGPGGGTIFYVNLAGFTCGASLNATCTYLEYGPANATNGSVWTPAASVVPGVETLATYSAGLTKAKIGLGASNTKAITDLAGNCPTPGSQSQCSAGYSASRYVVAGNSLTDWFLPNLAELNELCKFANNIFGTAETVACSPVSQATAQAKGFGTSLNSNWGWQSSSAFTDSKSPFAIHFQAPTAYPTFYTNNPLSFGTGGQLVRAIRAF